MRVGLSYGEALDLPIGELVDYMTIEMVKNEGLRLKQDELEDEEDFFKLLKRG